MVRYRLKVALGKDVIVGIEEQESGIIEVKLGTQDVECYFVNNRCIKKGCAGLLWQYEWIKSVY